MAMSSTSKRRIVALGAALRVALYRQALEAWLCALEQQHVDTGATRAEARITVRERHAASLRQGYPRRVQMDRDAFMDHYVAAAAI